MKTFCAKGSGQCSCAKFHADPNNCERGVPIMKTSTLTGPELNAAVAMALGQKVYRIPKPLETGTVLVLSCHDDVPSWPQSRRIPKYSTDIAAAWPIMKKHKIAIDYTEDEAYANVYRNEGVGQELVGEGDDPDPQIAALRAFVASVFGDEVELP